MTDVVGLLIGISIIVASLVFILFVAWVIAVQFNADEMSVGFMNWSKKSLLKLSRMPKFRVIVGIIAFYWVIFGFVIRLTFFPNMPDEHWIVLILMIMLSYNVFAYFYGWTMHIVYSHTKPNDPKSHRVTSLFVSAIGVAILVYAWVRDGSSL